MPTSSNIFKTETSELLKFINPKTAFDVGVGMGKYGNMLKEVVPNCLISGCEVEPKYLHDYKDSHAPYTNIINKSIVNIINSSELNFDLVIFGDILEHLKYSEVFDVLDYFQYRSKYILLSYPNKLRQGAWEGHMSERHMCEVRLSELSSKYNVIRYIKKTEAHFVMNLCLIQGYL